MLARLAQQAARPMLMARASRTLPSTVAATRTVQPLLLRRALCATSKDPPQSKGPDAAGMDAASAPEPPPTPPPTPPLGETSDRTDLTLQDHEGDNLPPLAFEPGIAGAAQKGVSAIVIVFGAAAFGACAYGISLALFPSATSTNVIYSEAFEKIKADPNVSYALGSPMRAYGIDHGGERGRRNAMERWEVQENGKDLSIVRFTVAGPGGAGVVQVQVPAQRRRGEFRYIIFENRRNRQLFHVLDKRAEEAAAEAAAAEAAAVAAAANTTAAA